MVSEFMQQPHEIHSQKCKRTLIYLQGTLHYGVFYSSNAIVSLSGYPNYDCLGDRYDRWSSVGYIFQLGSSSISWAKKKVKTLSLFACEVDYRASIEVAKEEVCLWHVLTEIGTVLKSSTMLKCDNQGAIQLLII